MPSSRRLRLSNPARRDLAGIADYTLRAWGEKQKAKYLGVIGDRFRALRNSPGLGVAREDIAPGLRAHPAGRHIIFYREVEDAVEIVRVLHQSMDVERRITGDPEV